MPRSRSYRDAPSPFVPASLIYNDDLWKRVEPIWHMAQNNRNAYPALKTGLRKGLIASYYLHYDLACYVRAFQPPETKAPSAFAYPSLAMLLSLVMFLGGAIMAHILYLGCTYGLPLTDASAQALGLVARVYGAIRIAIQQHTDPMDPYTLEVLVGLWNIACAYPSALRQHAYLHSVTNDDLRHNYALRPHQRDLAWALHKLKEAAKFRLRRSSTSPIRIQTLPPEVLSCIFQYLPWIPPFFTAVYDEHDSWNVTSHLAARLVCRIFHQIVDETSVLWPPLAVGFGLEMTELAIRLSKQRPLDIDIIRGDFTYSHVLALRELGRVRVIKLLETSSWDIFETVFELLRDSTAPTLEYLEICPYMHFEGHRILLLPEDILTGTPPKNLTTVIISDCTIIRPSPIFTPSLVTLQLTGCDVFSDLTAMVVTITSLPALRTFLWNMSLSTLGNSDSAVRPVQEADFLTSDHPPVALPQMRSFSIACPVTCAAALMQFLVVPPSCAVHLEDDYTLTGVRLVDLDKLAEIIASLSASLGNHLSRVFAQSDAGYDIISVSEHPCDVTQTGSLLIECHRSDRAYPPCSISLRTNTYDFEVDREVLGSILRSILRWPAMNAAATRFETNNQIFSSAMLWTLVLERLPHTRTLSIENSSEADASASILGLSQALTDALELAPSLTHIRLNHLSFPPFYQQRLAEAARLRRSVGRPVIELEVECCDEVGVVDLENIIRVHAGGTLRLNVWRV